MPGAGWILVIINFLDTGLGYILNVFILVAGVKSLKTGQKLNPPDLMNLVIGIANIALQCFLILQGLLSTSFISSLSMREVYVPITVGTLTLTYFTYWLTAWLCVYYCVSISNFNHPFFLWSKRNISMYLPHLLLLSAAGCFFISLPAIWTASMQITLQSPVNSTNDPIFITGYLNLHPLYIQASSSIGCYAPFLLILLSIIITNSSLIRHLQKIKQKDSGLSQTNYQAHINAIRTMWCFLTISIIFCISEILLFSRSLSPEDPYIIFSGLIFMSFPTSESLIIIFANPKLRKQMMAKVLWFNRKILT
ncbi:taste receptor type 2 member 40-like [Anomaloglossus baeobatrachus]|uniref:taste receptor type 2 member 40-like n=1 Tax=Anomaloglossus baeobatrachus TaxID=238106 RepID=UPI003F4F5986